MTCSIRLIHALTELITDISDIKAWPQALPQESLQTPNIMT